ncbi:MAG: T9SS type A sorting domain-containing protein [Calditrichia bacterium]|nr:T9SS type A sorting domain-containing protein [Calditrichia bacterium]
MPVKITILLIILFCFSVEAQTVQYNQEFRVNTTDDANKPGVSGLFDGGFVVCWQSFGQDRGRYNIYGKYYLGTPILHLLQSFSLIFPAYDAILYSTTVNFQWQKTSPIHVNFPWELTYKLYLDVTEDFSNPEIFSDIYDSTFSVKNLSPGQTYFWKVLAKTYEGDSLWSSETFGFYVSPAAGIEDDLVLKPETFKLYPNYPNPFNPETTIRYSLPADQSAYRVIIKIYDVLGQLVKILKDEQQRPGLYHLIWNGRNAAGQAVPSGVYFCVLDAGSFRATQKMLLVR